MLELEVEEPLAGLRPGTPDNAPIIGRSPSDPRIVWATGHYRNGVLLAPVTADLVVAELAGEPVEHAFGPARFAPVRVHGGGARDRRSTASRASATGATIVELLADLGVEERARGVAVAVNGEIVPRADGRRTASTTGDRVEALSAMQGG